MADDVTGATDLAGYVARSGASVVQIFGVPTADVELPSGVDCVVVALKSRSIPAQDAVSQSRAAFAWLSARGVSHLYFKYCSTFDSTPRGNIGPVADALRELTGSGPLIVAPSAPENGRTVFQANLFVGDRPLSESPLRDHPINPMRDSDLRRVLAAQTRGGIAHVPLGTVGTGVDAVRAALDAHAAAGVAHVVVDAITDGDLDIVARAALELGVSSGSAGLAGALARVHPTASDPSAVAPTVPGGRTVVLSGSCSTATRRQVELFARDHATYELDPRRLRSGAQTVDEAIAFVAGLDDAQVPLIYSSADAAAVAVAQEELGIDAAAALVENAFAEIASRASDLGVRRFVVAGGETSGAVTRALGVESIRIGSEVAPGVPWTVSTSGVPVALVLKSGNFGADTFFTDALEALDDASDRGESTV